MLTYNPFDSDPSAASPVRSVLGNRFEGAFGPVNVGEFERYGSILGGAALVVTGLTRRNLPGLLLAGLGGLFIIRGAGGHCLLYKTVDKS